MMPCWPNKAIGSIRRILDEEALRRQAAVDLVGRYVSNTMRRSNDNLDLCGLDGAVFLDRSLPTADALANPAYRGS